MKVALVFLVLVAITAKSLAVSPACTLCGFLVDGLAKYQQQNLPKEQIKNMLDKISESICSQLPAELVTKDQCTSYITLYGPYTVDLLFSTIDKNEVCGVLGVCSTNGPNYDIIFPQITNDKVVYSVRQTNLVAKHKYSYKFFVGNFTNLDPENLLIHLVNIKGCKVTIQVASQVGYATSCSETPCAIVITAPEKGVWYYLNATVNSVSTKDAEFTLEATITTAPIGDDDDEQVVTVHIPILLFLPCLVMSICICCLCCCRRKKCKAQKKVEESGVAIDLQQMPQEMPVAEVEVPVGYYYPQMVPLYTYNMGQYIPMAPTVPSQDQVSQ